MQIVKLVHLAELLDERIRPILWYQTFAEVPSAFNGDGRGLSDPHNVKDNLGMQLILFPPGVLPPKSSSALTDSLASLLSPCVSPWPQFTTIVPPSPPLTPSIPLSLTSCLESMGSPRGAPGKLMPSLGPPDSLPLNELL
jgi:hypothetical protein